jgi:hypothetical protein
MNKKHHEDAACRPQPLGDALEQICDLVQDGAQVGIDLLGGLCELKGPLLCAPFQLPRLFCAPLQLPTLCALPQLALLPRLSACLTPAKGCGCEIPPPCWAPQPIGDVDSGACPGATATIRIRVTNCGATARTLTIDAIGTGVTVSPSSLPLGPMERGHVVVSTALPPDADLGTEREVLVWVRGCHDHFLRWTIRVSRDRDCGCEDVHVEDCPDYVHHWYDHFYCARPCVHGV